MFVRGSNCYAVLLICMLLATSCKKDAPDFPEGSSEAINGWIHDQMEQYYYWSSALPPAANYNHSPKDFFQSLLVKEDRFSSMMLSGKTDTYGTTLLNTFGFDFIQFKVENATISLISHVVPGSTGDRLGLQRGDTLQHINGQLPTENRLSVWLQQATQQTSIFLTLANGTTYTLPAAYISQPVIYPSEVFMADGDNKVGYLFLSHFDFSGGYDLLKAIEKLQTNGVQELILDLRYNSGGSVAFAAFVALALADVQPNDMFVHYKGNGRLQNLQETFAQTLARQPDGYSFAASDVRQKGLGFRRLLILGTGHTASASEMLINNLRPYIEVIHIGDSTYGKDMASTTLTTPASVVGTSSVWHILPMIYKIYNAQDQGEYQNGLQPQWKIAEHNTLSLYPFGDKRDALVAEALARLGYGEVQIKSEIRHRVNGAAEQQLLFQSAPYLAQPIEIQTIK